MFMIKGGHRLEKIVTIHISDREFNFVQVMPRP